MPSKLAKHGSEAGYQAEIRGAGITCTRCQAAHREYGRQYTNAGKAAGLKYERSAVIDHLAKPAGRRPGIPRRERARVQVPTGTAQTDALAGDPGRADDTSANTGTRLSDRVRGLWVPSPDDAQPYVEADGAPDYLRPVDPDPEPDGEWNAIDDADFVVNAAGIKKIEENLGTYISIVGITIEMIDPYCGPILAANLDNMVQRWSKVIANYPAAAKLFLDSKGGMIFLWIGALQATWPVLYALYEHHLSRNIRTENGQVFRKNQSAFRGDATTPPMPDTYDYSAA